jgi:hypothetical protein
MATKTKVKKRNLKSLKAKGSKKSLSFPEIVKEAENLKLNLALNKDNSKSSLVLKNGQEIVNILTKKKGIDKEYIKKLFKDSSSKADYFGTTTRKAFLLVIAKGLKLDYSKAKEIISFNKSTLNSKGTKYESLELKK